MSSMENLISEFFAQDTGSSNLEKQAQVELFAKLAAQNGIDLENLSEGQIAHLWNETFKTASEDEDEKKKDEDEKKKEAEAEFAEKRAAAAKLAEAEYLGRYMAHALTDEIRKIASGDLAKEASTADLRKAKGIFGRGGQLLSGSRRDALKDVADTMNAHTGVSEKGRRVVKALRGQEKSEANKVLGARVGAGAAGVAAVGGAAAAGRASKGDKEKKSSAIDELAAERGVVKAAEAGFDPSEAAERLDAVLTLGTSESEKIASASDLETAVEIRSLELLEAAGYPVNWS